MAMTMKPKTGRPTPPQDEISDEMPMEIEPEAKEIPETDNGKLRGFMAGFLNSQGVTSEGLPIPYSALPLQVSRAIQEIAEIKCVSEGMVFGQFLSMLSVAGRTRCVRRRNDWREHGNLYVIVIADSGGGKTHSMNHVFKDIIARDSYLQREYRTKRREYAIEYAEWMKKPKSERGAAPDAPPKLRHIVKDSTMAGLVETFESNPRGLLWQVNEMAGFFAGVDGHSKTGATEAKRKFLDAYDALDLSADRRSKDGQSQDYHVPDAALSIYGHVQSNLLGEVFTERDLHQGLDQRFLFVRAKRGKSPHAHDNEISDTTDALISKISQYIMSLDLGDQYVHINEDVTDVRRVPIDVELCPEARASHNEFYDALMQSTYGDPIEESFAQKMAGQTLRVALLLHLLHNATQPTRCDEINADAMYGARKIVTWCAWNLRQVWNLLPGGKGQPGQEAQVYRAAEFIRNHPNFAAEWHTAGEIISAGLKWHGPDAATQAKNLGGFLTGIINSNGARIKEADAKGKKNGLQKYRLETLRAVLEEMDARAR